MPIGPRGERLPYNGNMGGGPGPDLPPSGRDATSIVNAGIDGTNASMGLNRQRPGGGGQAEALVQRFLSTASELKQITDQLAGMGIDANQLLAGEVTTGGGPEEAVGGVGGMPQMPVAANTVPSGGGLLGGVV